MSPHALGIDLGGTQIRAGLVDGDGRVVRKVAVPTPAAEGPVAVLDAAASAVFALIGERSAAKIGRVGLCAPGPLDADNGLALSIPTLPGFVDLPMAALLAQRIGCPVDLENDGIAAVHGEWRFGAGRGVDNLVFVTLSTGVGGGVVCDGRIVRGRMGMAGHVGHITIIADGARCPCGNLGCWEAYASGTAFTRRARERAAAVPSTRLHEGPIDARSIFAAAAGGDALAGELVAEQADYVGIGLVNLLHAYSPERLVIGGGVSNGLDALMPGIRRRIDVSAMPPFRSVPIVRAELADDAGLVGVATLARARLERGAALNPNQDEAT